MRKYFFILAFLPLYLLGQDPIYVDPINGDDGNDGSSYAQRIKTLEQLSSIIDDATRLVYLFDTVHNGVLSLLDIDGNAHDSIVFRVYSEYGKTCRITNKKTLTVFTDEGDNVWSKVDADISGSTSKAMYFNWQTKYYFSAVNLWINGVKQNISKEPDTHAIYQMTAKDEVDPGTWFEDDNNSAWGDDYWNGGTACMHIDFLKKSTIEDYSDVDNRFTIDAPIGDLCPWNDCGSFPNEPKYFIINHINALSTNGEYVHDADNSRIYIYYDGNLNEQTVQVSISDTVVGLASCSYIRFVGIVFEGGDKTTIWMDNCYKIWFDSCTFQDAPLAAITTDESDSLYFNNDLIQNTNGSGLVISDFDELYVEDCIFNNIGAVHEMLGGGDHYFTGMGIITVEQNGFYQINHCHFDSLGGAAIINESFEATTDYDYEVTNNLVQYASMNYVDMAAIYSYYYETGGVATIKNNIVLHTGYGAFVHWEGYTQGDARGIYLDEYVSNVYVDSNSIYDCQSGIYLNVESTNDTITNNKIYYTTRENTYAWARGLHQRENCGDNDYNHNVVLVDNHDLDSSLVVNFTASGDFSTNGTTYDYNTYLSPYYAVKRAFRLYENEALYYDLDGWQTKTTFEANSTYDNTVYDTTLMFCNWTDSEHTFTFDATSADDENGDALDGSVDVPRFYSAIVRINGLNSNDDLLYTGEAEEESGDSESRVYFNNNGSRVYNNKNNSRIYWKNH